MRSVPEAATCASRSIRSCVGWSSSAIHASGFPVARTPGWAEMTSENCRQSPTGKKFTSCASIRSANRTPSGSWRPRECRIPTASIGMRGTAGWKPSFRTPCYSTFLLRPPTPAPGRRVGWLHSSARARHWPLRGTRNTWMRWTVIRSRSRRSCSRRVGCARSCCYAATRGGRGAVPGTTNTPH